MEIRRCTEREARVRVQYGAWGQCRRAHVVNQAVDQRLLRPDHDQVNGLLFAPHGEIAVILDPWEAHRKPGDLFWDKQGEG